MRDDRARLVDRLAAIERDRPGLKAALHALLGALAGEEI